MDILPKISFFKVDFSSIHCYNFLPFFCIHVYLFYQMYRSTVLSHQSICLFTLFSDLCNVVRNVSNQKGDRTQTRWLHVRYCTNWATCNWRTVLPLRFVPTFPPQWTLMLYLHPLVHRMQFNSEEKWTKALKFMLTNLKWGLAWVSSQFANK